MLVVVAVVLVRLARLTWLEELLCKRTSEQESKQLEAEMKWQVNDMEVGSTKRFILVALVNCIQN